MSTGIRGLPEAVADRAGFGARSVPAMSRRNYRYELRSALVLPFLMAVFEGSLISILVRIAFEDNVNQDLLNSLSGVIAVAPALGNLTSFVWVRLSHGRGKIRFITTLQAVMIGLAAIMAIAPRNEIGLWVITVVVLLGRSTWAGVTTIRSTIWKQNYPDADRARVTGRFAQIMVLTIAVLAMSLGALMEWQEWTFRVAVPIGCVMGLVARWCWGRIRVRGHAGLVARERETSGRSGPSFNPLRMAGVLAGDRRYGAYMGCQFLLGIGNIMSMALLAVILRERFGLDYFGGLLAGSSIQYGVMPLVIPLWAKLLDRTHIVRYRAIHSWVFVVALGLLLTATVTGWVWLVFVFAVIKGVAFAGGVLGWTLGHLDFAPPERTSEYMGVHVTLTGVRGVISAACAVPMYELLGGDQGGATPAVAVCLVLTTMGAIGFVAMQPMVRGHGRHGAPPSAPSPTSAGS